MKSIQLLLSKIKASVNEQRLFPFIFHIKNWDGICDKSRLPSNILNFTLVHEEFESNWVFICELNCNEMERNKIKRILYMVIIFPHKTS
ncbi:hypothetical protein CQ022_21790 [Chryseobacterium culicis]|uniref:Uncharacterized protein n=1 Tax=Chryseobacterium culicis TaxID=680127 RepID=A0A2S9CIN3_CHRCI|nr:hypothetical protein CQ022_21790 [Chryseobacterium culicis]PRB87402.1 hypothetical protein CQ033_21795 [Chryseobacterium culicis]